MTEIDRAKLVAKILTDNGQPVSSPDEWSLDDVEMERWSVCLEIVRALDVLVPAPRRRLASDPIPDNWMEISAEEYPLCPECGGDDLSLTAAPNGRWWSCGCGREGPTT